MTTDTVNFSAEICYATGSFQSNNSLLNTVKEKREKEAIGSRARFSLALHQPRSNKTASSENFGYLVQVSYMNCAIMVLMAPRLTIGAEAFDPSAGGS